MPLARPSDVLTSLLVALLAVPTPVLSAATSSEQTTFSRPTPAAAPFAVLAQNAPDDKDNKKKRRGKPGQNDDKGGGKQGAGKPDAGKQGGGKQGGGKLDNAKQGGKPDKGGKPQDASKQPPAKQPPPPFGQTPGKKKTYQERQLEAIQQQQKLHEQIKQKQALEKQKRLDAEKARQDAANKKKQLDAQQAKDKAIQQQKMDAERGRQDAINKNKLDAEKARQDAINRKKQDEQKAQDRGRDRKPDKGAPSRQSGPPAKFDKSKMDIEFQKAREEARRQQDRDGRPGKDGRPGNRERWRDGSDAKFEKVRHERKERDFGSRRVIIEPDKRVIVRRGDRTYIRHDDGQRFNRIGRELRRERQKNGALMVVTMGLAGALIYTLQDDHGRVLRRSRKGRDGREFVLYDNTRYYRGRSSFGPAAGRDYDYDDYDGYVDVPPPLVRIPRDQYIVDYDRASPEEIYETLNAPPIEALDRGYSLDEVRQSYNLLERMRRVDLDAINFEFGSWEVEADQYPKLERIAKAMLRILDRSPDEVFFVEGHTDAVGSDIDNLSLSDRRAEQVAVILSEEFGVPPENLTTQGYGEEHLKELTDEASRINRRVSVRRITPLLSRESNYDEPR